MATLVGIKPTLLVSKTSPSSRVKAIVSWAYGDLRVIGMPHDISQAGLHTHTSSFRKFTLRTAPLTSGSGHIIFWYRYGELNPIFHVESVAS